MSRSDYKIKYSSKDQFYVMVMQRIGDWLKQLETMQSKLYAISTMGSFQGKTAEAVKAYINEVHGILLISIRQTLIDFQTRANLFVNGYYDIESNIYGSIPQGTLAELKSMSAGEREYLCDEKSAISKVLSSISDLLPLNNPSQSNLLAAMEDMEIKIADLDQQMLEYEENKATEANEDVATLISALYLAVQGYYLEVKGITGYQAGMYIANTAVLDLYDKVAGSMAYTEKNQNAAIDAANNMQEVFAQQQADYEAACEARKDEGMAQAIVGAVTVVTAATVIVLTAGAATPIVVTACVSGGCAMAYGASEISEGMQNYVYGSIGDVTTAAWNPIRDTVFCGNQQLYDAWGSLSVTVSSLCIPVSGAVNSVAGATSSEVVKKVIVTVAKEQIVGGATGYVGDKIVEGISDKYELNKTQTTLLNIAVEQGLDKCADAVEGQIIKTATGSTPGDFVEGMSYEDAKRYNAYVNEKMADAQSGVSAVDTADIVDQDFVDIDWENTSNTAAEQALIREMDANGEFIVSAEDAKNAKTYIYDGEGNLLDVKKGGLKAGDYGTIEVTQATAPSDPRNRLPTETSGTIIGDRESGTFEFIPKDKGAQAIMEQYGEKTIKYQNTEADFSPYAKQSTPWGDFDCEVEIGHMTGERLGVEGNYAQADALLAEKMGISEEQLKTYRQNNGLTWHEVGDGKTMQLIPTVINDSCAHRGGVSEMKYRMQWGDISKDFGE